MKAREKCPCFFLSTNLCRSGFTPPALRARKPGAKAPITKGARRLEPSNNNQSQKLNNGRLSKPMNRKPSPRPRPRLSTVCPALALPGLPLPRRLRFARLCPSRLRFAPSSPGLRRPSFLSLPSFPGRSARFSGALRPRRVGFSLAVGAFRFSLDRRVGFSRSWAVSVCPRSAGGGGGGLASGPVCVAGVAVRSGALPSPLIPLETTQTF